MATKKKKKRKKVSDEKKSQVKPSLFLFNFALITTFGTEDQMLGAFFCFLILASALRQECLPK